MPGKANAVASGKQLVDAVVALGQDLNLEVMTNFRLARRIWGAERYIDVILIHPQTRKTLGVECKYQGGGGSAEEKIPSTIDDISAWPIPGIVVFSGVGFTMNMRHYLISTGKAVELEEVRPWFCLFFGLPLEQSSKPAKLKKMAEKEPDYLIELKSPPLPPRQIS